MAEGVGLIRVSLTPSGLSCGQSESLRSARTAFSSHRDFFVLLRKSSEGVGFGGFFCCFQCQNTLIIRLIKQYLIQLIQYSFTTKKGHF